MSGAVPPPTARPPERAARVPRPVCPGCGRGGRVDPAPAPQRAPLRAGVARCGGGGGGSPEGVPSTVVRGAWCQALSLPRPPVLWSGQPGFRNPCVPGAVDAGVWTQHRPHSVRPCGTALLAVGVAGGRPRGGGAFHRCVGRLVSGAVPPPAARPLERAARVPRPVCPGRGRCGRVDPAPAPERAPLRAGVARCGGGGRASPGGGAFHCCEGRQVSGAVPPPAACPLERAARVPVCVCVRVRALLGRVGRAGLPGAFWCASPFPLAALSFCFAWPPPGWGCPPLSRCPCCSSLPWRCALVLFLGLPLPGSSCARASFVSPAWPLAALWWFLPPPPPFLCLAVFVAPAWCLGFVFFFFSLFFPPLCAPVVSGFLLFPAPGALGLGAVCVLLCWPSASRLSVRLSLCRAFRLAGGCSPSVAAPPPLFCLAVFVAAARCCVPCAVLCCASLGAVLRRAAARCVLRCCAVLCCVVLVGCRCLLRRALWRCPLPWGPVLCGAAFCGVPPCCVCFVVARWCVPLFAALLCAVCVQGSCAVRSLSSPLCAVLCFAVLVRSRCAVRVVRAVAGAWCCGVPWCGAGSAGPWFSAGGVFRCRCPCLAAWSVSLRLVWFAVVPCFPVSCSVVLCCRVVLCCCALLSCCGAVGACFALLWAVVLCCVVLLVGCAVFCPVVVAACCGALLLVLCVPCLLRSVRCGALLCWLWCPASLCRVLWRCAVVWCCAVVLCCRFAVLFVFALPSCGPSCGASVVCAVVGASCCGVSLCDVVFPWAFCGVVVLLWCVVVSCCAVRCPVVSCAVCRVLRCRAALLGLFLAWVWSYLLEKPLPNFVKYFFFPLFFFFFFVFWLLKIK